IRKDDPHLFLEFRFDFLEDFSNLDKILESISKYKKQSIYTLRPSYEGGRYSKNEADRLTLLKKLAKSEPMLLDLEYNALSKDNELADFVDNNNVRTLVSWHNFEQTPPIDVLIDLIDRMRVFSNYIKLVTTARTIDDSINILQLYRLIDTSINLIAFSMGELGILSRVLCNVVGDSPFTYASIEKAVAPGQLTIKEMRMIYSLFHNKFLL
ncbi:MAG TPA: type I 3-dehydroquinate dehydratase, partial [Candidatus Nitrosocosmicus sp.]